MNKKLDYLNSKTDGLTRLCHQTVDTLTQQFAKIQQPILSKVEDLRGVSELYRMEIERTQKHNRDILHNFVQVKYEINEARRDTYEGLARMSITEAGGSQVAGSHAAGTSFRGEPVIERSQMDTEKSVMQSQMQAAIFGKSVILEEDGKVRAPHDSLIYDTSLLKGSIAEQAADANDATDVDEREKEVSPELKAIGMEVVAKITHRRSIQPTVADQMMQLSDRWRKPHRAINLNKTTTFSRQSERGSSTHRVVPSTVATEKQSQVFTQTFYNPKARGDDNISDWNGSKHTSITPSLNHPRTAPGGKHRG